MCVIKGVYKVCRHDDCLLHRPYKYFERCTALYLAAIPVYLCVMWGFCAWRNGFSFIGGVCRGGCRVGVCCVPGQRRVSGYPLLFAVSRALLYCQIPCVVTN